MTRDFRKLQSSLGFVLGSLLLGAPLELRFEEAVVWKMTLGNPRDGANFQRSHLGTVSGATVEVTVVCEDLELPNTACGIGAPTVGIPLWSGRITTYRVNQSSLCVSVKRRSHLCVEVGTV